LGTTDVDPGLAWGVVDEMLRNGPNQGEPGNNLVDCSGYMNEITTETCLLSVCRIEVIMSLA